MILPWGRQWSGKRIESSFIYLVCIQHLISYSSIDLMIHIVMLLVCLVKLRLPQTRNGSLGDVACHHYNIRTRNPRLYFCPSLSHTIVPLWTDAPSHLTCAMQLGEMLWSWNNKDRPWWRMCVWRYTVTPDRHTISSRKFSSLTIVHLKARGKPLFPFLGIQFLMSIYNLAVARRKAAIRLSFRTDPKPSRLVLQILAAGVEDYIIM